MIYIGLTEETDMVWSFVHSVNVPILISAYVFQGIYDFSRENALTNSLGTFVDEAPFIDDPAATLAEGALVACVVDMFSVDFLLTSGVYGRVCP